MNQLEIFNNKSKIIKLFIDGAARNNPGPAGAGIHVTQDEKTLLSESVYLGSKTNNQAEYLSLLLGLFQASKFLKQNDILEIISDSELLVRQILGTYKIKNESLKKLHAIAINHLKKINYKIMHVLRDQNKIADKNANIAIDKKKQAPIEFLEFLNQHEISL